MLMTLHLIHATLMQHKCHFIIMGNTPEHLWESQQEELLGLTVDKNLNFNEHLSMICKKASAKVSALTRMAMLIPLGRRKI